MEKQIPSENKKELQEVLSQYQSEEPKNYEEYYEKSGMEIIDVLHEMMLTKRISGIEGLEMLYEEKQSLDQDVEQLYQEAQKLRQDIMLFTRAVEEASSRYKLSPDWEGRKAPLMEVRRQLEVRRTAYEEKENKVNQKIQEICGKCEKVVGDDG